jgi:hypothetical protein
MLGNEYCLSDKHEECPDTRADEMSCPCPCHSGFSQNWRMRAELRKRVREVMEEMEALDLEIGLSLRAPGQAIRQARLEGRFDAYMVSLKIMKSKVLSR